MKRKILVYSLCALLAAPLCACGQGPQGSPGGGEETAPGTEAAMGGTQAAGAEDAGGAEAGAVQPGDTQEALLGADATDEELLEAIREDIHVVSDDNYIEAVTGLKEQAGEYAGQIYQLEGEYRAGGAYPCVTRAVAGGEEISLPLKYVAEDVAEGSWIRVTGIVGQGEAGGETPAALEVLVLEEAAEPGQRELPAAQ